MQKGAVCVLFLIILMLLFDMLHLNRMFEVAILLVIAIGLMIYIERYPKS